MTLPAYDPTSPQSILEYAGKLYGKSLLEAIEETSIPENIQDKGKLGSLVEQLFFRITPGNDHAPDFKDAGVELKTTGLKLNTKKELRAKERLVLTMINYLDIVDESFQSSTFFVKCQLMLLLFYLYEKDLKIYERRFVLKPLLFTFPEEDLAIIKKDWETIQQKIKDGRAHELSEGDTFYLGACRKGAGGIDEVLRKQPFSEIGAKSRAFSLKPSYMNLVLDRHIADESVLDESILVTAGIEEATLSRFAPYIGKKIDELSAIFGHLYKGKNHKGFYRELAMHMLGAAGKRSVPELEKAGIETKIIRLQENGIPKEDMSFPTFKYMDIINEGWEDSSFFDRLERKFLFVVFQYDADGNLHFTRAKYWNMPYEDREEARRVWEDTKRRVLIDASDLPKITESHVAHVRPKAKDGNDTLPTPQGLHLVKKCFWLNKKYIAMQLSQ